MLYISTVCAVVQWLGGWLADCHIRISCQNG